MKNILYLTIGFLFLIGCTKEFEQNSSFTGNDDWSSEFSKYIENAQKNILNFSNIEELEKTIDTLLSFNENELKEWYGKKGFISQGSLYDNAICELEKLESKESAVKFKNKYKHFFLFNEKVTDEDLSPYLPSSKIGYSYICNIYGQVRINGVEYNFNDYKSFEDTNYARYIRGIGQTKANSSTDNRLYMETKDRKFWAEVHRSDFRIRIKLSAHKKSFIGWNKYQTQYNMQLQNFDKTDWACDWSTENGCELNGLHLLTKTGNAPFYNYTTPEVSSGHEFHLGKSATFRDPNNGGFLVYIPVYLTMHVSTRGISGGTLIINYPNM